MWHSCPHCDPQCYGNRDGPVLDSWSATAGLVLDSCWTCGRTRAGPVPNAGLVLDLCWTCAGLVLDSCQMLDSCWTSGRPLLENCWTRAGQMLSSCWARACPLLDSCWTAHAMATWSPSSSDVTTSVATCSSSSVSLANLVKHRQQRRQIRQRARRKVLRQWPHLQESHRIICSTVVEVVDIQQAPCEDAHDALSKASNVRMRRGHELMLIHAVQFHAKTQRHNAHTICTCHR